jgi:predicted nucleic acid-binding protein
MAFLSSTIYTKLDELALVDFPRDRKDAKFIACAQTVNADFLITGDRDFTEAQNLGRTRIISVSLFKQFFVDMMTN